MSSSRVGVPRWSGGIEVTHGQQGTTERTIGFQRDAHGTNSHVMSLQPLHRKRLAFEVDDQRRGEAAVEGEFGPALQIALQDHGRYAFDQRATWFPDQNCVVLSLYVAEPQSANRR